MWLLVITLWSVNPTLPSTSGGSVYARFGYHEECLRAKERVMDLKIDGYRIVASCTYRG